MKKTAYILSLGLLMISAVSCSDAFFNEHPSNDVFGGDFYKTEGDFNQAVYSCYSHLKTEMGFLLTEIGYRSDEAALESMAVSTQDRYDLDHFQENSSNPILSGVWSEWYKGIYFCNDVLDHLKTTTLPASDALARYKGECLFLRSWYYFNLYRAFGGVPLITRVVSASEAKTIRRATPEEMLTRMEEDLQEAAGLLPLFRPSETQRVSKIAAQALLGKVYLTYKKYDEAKGAYEEALADANYGLMDSVEDVFDVEQKMNKEIILALCYNKSNDFGHGYWWTESTNVEEDRHLPTEPTRALFASGDKRLPLIRDFIRISSSVYVMPKWYDTYDAVYTTKVGNDFPLIRYADVVLGYAEALGLGGDIPAAVPYLNRTRTRSGLSALGTDLTKEQFIQELSDERGREFTYEGHRWFDLVRLGLAVDYFQSLGYPIDDHELIFPIPNAQIEIYNNPSILWQNPGY